ALLPVLRTAMTAPVVPCLRALARTHSRIGAEKALTSPDALSTAYARRCLGVNCASPPALAGPARSFLASGECRYDARRHGTAHPSRHWRWPRGPPAWAIPQCLWHPEDSEVTAFLPCPGSRPASCSP